MKPESQSGEPAQAEVRQQQLAFQRFEQEYNKQLPHESLSWRTPADLYAASARCYPSRLPELE
jgi:putative transposase